MATIGPADLPILLSQNITNIVGLTGAGVSPKFVVTRNGVDIKTWEDLKGKRIGVAPAPAVWFQFEAMVTEGGVPCHRPEERSGGKGWVRTGRNRWSPSH